MKLFKASGASASMSMADANLHVVKRARKFEIAAKDQLWSTFVILCVIFCVSVGLLAMFMEDTIVTYVAFFFPVLTGSAIIIQSKFLERLESFRKVNISLRQNVNALAMERNKLSHENGRMERQLKRMSGVQDRFNHLVQREGRDVRICSKMVKDNAGLQREMKTLQASQDLVDLFGIVLKSDRNQDNAISEDEMNTFVHRVRLFSTRRGKPLNEAALRDAFQRSMSKSIVSVFNHATTSLEVDVPVQRSPRSVVPETTSTKIAGAQMTPPPPIKTFDIPIESRQMSVHRAPPTVDMRPQKEGWITVNKVPPPGADKYAVEDPALELVAPANKHGSNTSTPPKMISQIAAVVLDPSGEEPTDMNGNLPRINTDTTNNTEILEGLLNSSSGDFTPPTDATRGSFSSAMV